MSSVLYYSKFCEHSKKLVNALGRSTVKNDIHFICIDNRINKNGSVYVIIENGQELLLPPTITKVPALLLLKDNHKVLFEEDIYKYLEPQQQQIQMKATNNNIEPLACSLGNDVGGSGFGVVSDNYSFLDMSSEDLSAKGAGGVRQLYNYATVSQEDKIYTPEDDYSPDKVAEGSMDKFQNDRDQDIKNIHQSQSN
jgi:hypothetical protein